MICSIVQVSLSLSLRDREGGRANKAGLIEASPPPSLCPSTATGEGTFFGSKEPRLKNLPQRVLRVSLGGRADICGVPSRMKLSLKK